MPAAGVGRRGEGSPSVYFDQSREVQAFHDEDLRLLLFLRRVCVPIEGLSDGFDSLFGRRRWICSQPEIRQLHQSEFMTARQVVCSHRFCIRQD